MNIMKTFLIFICILCLTSCVIVNDDKDNEFPLLNKETLMDGSGIRSDHYQVISKMFDKETSKLVKFYRDRQHKYNSDDFNSNKFYYEIVTYAYEYSYVYRITYSIEFVDDLITSIKEKNIIFIGEQIKEK